MPAPRLLVSVRSPEEAEAAIAGGAAIIDVKEPRNGPLGMASVEVCLAVSEVLQKTTAPPLSIALGELRDWLQPSSDRAATRKSLDFAASIPGLQWLKCGLAGCRDNPAWVTAWLQVRAALPAETGWVAVAYADAERAEAPELSEVLRAALENRAAALLIDTFVKDNTRLFDWLPPDQLKLICQHSRAAGLPVALAGRLTPDDIPQLLRIGPEIIAVRGAACVGNDRREHISKDLVASLVRQLAERASVG